MKLFAYALCGGLLLLSACGISQKQQTQMENSLYVALTDAFLQQDDFVAFAPKVDLLEIEKGESSVSPVDGYHGVFSCEFKSGENNVRIHGSAGFDKYGSVIHLPEGKVALDVFLIMVGTNREDAAKSVYNVPAFISHRGE